MKVAVVYNRESKRVINLFGMPNQEKYGLKSIKRITDALKKGGHQVIALEGDKDLITNLEEFMPRVVKGENPGMVFNLSYGIQGQARYTHVPGILEMIGLPYVGSGPLAHSLCLDKVVSKMIFEQNGISTPQFAVLENKDFEPPDIKYPVIVKPKNEAVSFGIQICKNLDELREGANVIFENFGQAVLVERYIPGREVNVGILGNSPPEALPVAELTFGAGGPDIYTYEDKTRSSGREISILCPAQLDEELTARAQDLAKRAFSVLGCFDCCRVDMRLDKDGNLYVLEVNSLPSLGEHGSYVEGAAHAGLDFTGLVNRLVAVAAARYFGTPTPPPVSKPSNTSSERIASFLSLRRDRMEKQVRKWTKVKSRTTDPIGIREAAELLDQELRDIGLKPVPEFTDPRVAWTWESKAGFQGGTLIIAQLDVPLDPEVALQPYRREPEWLYGEGIGSSRAPLVSLQYALRALRHTRRLGSNPIGVLFYSDEGRDCRYSQELISKAAAKAKRIIVLRPGNPGEKIVVGRRGQRRYILTVEGPPIRLGMTTKKTDVLNWLYDKLRQCSKLSSKKERVAVATKNIKTRSLPMYLPHKVEATLLVTYPDDKTADRTEKAIREILSDKAHKWRLEMVSSRPAMKERRASDRLDKSLLEIASDWDISLKSERSVWPSVAGLAPASVGAVCGMGPIARDLYTPHEAIQRISLLQRTLLLAEFLNHQTPEKRNGKKK